MCSDQSVFLSIGGQKYFKNNSNIAITRIGLAEDNLLTCHTDFETCCKSIHNPNKTKGSGEWLFPDGTNITKGSKMGDGFYWIRGKKTISLYRQGNTQGPLGSYCCIIPDKDNMNRTFCANIAGKLI